MVRPRPPPGPNLGVVFGSPEGFVRDVGGGGGKHERLFCVFVAGGIEKRDNWLG